MRVNVPLCGGSFESPPGVEAACEAVRLVSLPHQTQLPGVFAVLSAHVLDVNLKRRRGWERVKVRCGDEIYKSDTIHLTQMNKHTNFSLLLTWQALRLSLISTWLVWVPTHMYTWNKERKWCHDDVHLKPGVSTRLKWPLIRSHFPTLYVNTYITSVCKL